MGGTKTVKAGQAGFGAVAKESKIRLYKGIENKKKAT